MPSTAVDICNLALANLGDVASVSSISPPDASVQAQRCARFYPIARDHQLSMHPWNFATYRADLSRLALDPPPTWLYAYAPPNVCLRPVSLLATDASEDTKTEPFVYETQPDGTGVIYTNLEYATCLYIRSDVNPGRFSAPFVVALARLLSSYLAGPLIRGKEGRAEAKEQMRMWLEVELPMAKAQDQNSRKVDAYRNHRPSFLAAR